MQQPSSSSARVASRRKWSKRIASSLLLIGCGTALWGMKITRAASASDSSEINALKVLNDSDWAHTVSPTLQDKPCTAENPAFPGLFPQNRMATTDPGDPAESLVPAKPDHSEYLVRFQSVKPVQTATQQLLTMGDKWSAYGPERSVSSEDGPTDLAKKQYNVADMITIAVILKRADVDNPNLFEYAFEEVGHAFPVRGYEIWPCAALRTSNGQTFPRVIPTVSRHGEFKALQFSFPRLIDGKPLIAGTREKVDFRIVVKRRVFDATFYVNSADVLDGSEPHLYLPPACTLENNQLAHE